MGLSDRKALAPRQMLFDLLLWGLFLSMYPTEKWLQKLIPTWALLLIWCALLGGAIGGLRGRILKGVLIGVAVGPILVIALFTIAFIGG